MASRGENRLHLYKRRAPEQETRRKKLADERKAKRLTARTEAFAAFRGIPEEEPVASSRKQKLEEWKQRRQAAPKPARKGNEKKPAFVFKKVTYNDTHLYKPLESSTFHPPQGVVPVQSSQPDRQLRSRTRNQHKGPPQSIGEALSAFATAMAKTKPKKLLKVSKEQIPAVIPKSTDILNRTFDGTPTVEPSVVPPEDIQNNLENISKTEHKSNGPALIEQPEEQHSEKSADYFRSLHKDAVEKLNSLCNIWTKRQSQDLPGSVNDDIDVAVGYAQLLISQKLQQFLDLITEHEDTNSSTELKVLSSDLDGFWGIVNNQLQDIFNKFDKLETLSLNNWQDSSTNLLPVKGPSQNNSKKPKGKAKGHASTGLRSFLAQARKQAQADGENSKASAVFNSSLMQSRITSPIVMRVTSRAKQVGSPRTPTLSTSRSPLRNMQSENVQAIALTPKSTKRTSSHKRVPLSGSSSVRRSTRILKKLDVENID